MSSEEKPETQSEESVLDEELEEGIGEPEEEVLEPGEAPIEAEEEPTEEKVEEEKVKAEKKKKGKEEEIVEERFYTIPLGKASVRPPKKRAPRAIQIIKDFVTKHMKLEISLEREEEEGELPRLLITQDVNEKIWGKGIEKPPRKIRVRAAKDSDGNVSVYLAEGE